MGAQIGSTARVAAALARGFSASWSSPRRLPSPTPPRAPKGSAST